MATDYTNDGNCIGAWKLNETTGNAIDISSNGNDGTPGGTGYTQGQDGQFDKAIEFDGDSGYLDFGDITIFDGIGQFTLCCWLYVQSISGNWTSIIRKDGTLTPIQTSGSDFYFPIWDSGGSLKHQDSNYAVPKNEWFHYAVVWDKDVNDGKAAFYINGSKVADGSLGCTTTVYASGVKTLRFGATEADAENYDGLLDEVIFFRRTLNSTEINEIKDYGIDGGKYTSPFPVFRQT